MAPVREEVALVRVAPIVPVYICAPLRAEVAFCSAEATVPVGCIGVNATVIEVYSSEPPTVRLVAAIFEPGVARVFNPKTD
jgi:hypothetical protein